MQICLFVLTAILWTYTVYFVIKAINANVTDKVMSLFLDIFVAIFLFLVGLGIYIAGCNVDENPTKPTYDYYNNTYYYYRK